MFIKNQLAVKKYTTFTWKVSKSSTDEVNIATTRVRVCHTHNSFKLLFVFSYGLWHRNLSIDPNFTIRTNGFKFFKVTRYLIPHLLSILFTSRIIFKLKFERRAKFVSTRGSTSRTYRIPRQSF